MSSCNGNSLFILLPFVNLTEFGNVVIYTKYIGL